MGRFPGRCIDRKISVQKKGDFEKAETLVALRREVRAFQLSSVGEEPIRCLRFRQFGSNFRLLMS